jgi:hypothetical protein
MGIEKPQLGAIFRLFWAEPGFVPGDGLMTFEHKTPNQKALAAAIRFAWARLIPGGIYPDGLACAQVRDLFAAMDHAGHQAVGAGYGAEGGCPDRHNELWMGALATILREARLQNVPDIRALAIRYFYDHVAMCRAFWTPAGVRIPGSRAKAFEGMPLRPSWVLDSRFYAEMTGAPTAGLPRLWAPDTMDILRDCREDWPAIVRLSAGRNPLMAVAIHKWALPGGGFLAALEADVPMNDRLSWIAVDAAGTITGASHTLADLPPPPSGPSGVFGDPSFAWVDPVTASAGGTSSPPPSPPATGDDARLAWAARIEKLLLSHHDQAAREEALALVMEGTPAALAQAAVLVGTFGIGEGQEQAADWHALTDELAAAGGA